MIMVGLSSIFSKFQYFLFSVTNTVTFGFLDFTNSVSKHIINQSINQSINQFKQLIRHIPLIFKLYVFKSREKQLNKY